MKHPFEVKPRNFPSIHCSRFFPCARTGGEYKTATAYPVSVEQRETDTSLATWLSSSHIFAVVVYRASARVGMLMFSSQRRAVEIHRNIWLSSHQNAASVKLFSWMYLIVQILCQVVRCVRRLDSKAGPREDLAATSHTAPVAPQSSCTELSNQLDQCRLPLPSISAQFCA